MDNKCLIIAPDVIRGLQPNEVFVFPTYRSGNLYRGLSTQLFIGINGYKSPDIPRKGAQGSLYGIRVMNTPKKGDFNAALQEEMNAFVQFAWAHQEYLFLMSKDGWKGKGAAFPFDLERFVEDAYNVGNIAVSPIIYNHSGFSCNHRRLGDER